MTYLYLGAAFVMACLVAGLLWFRGEAASARAERDQAKAALTIAVATNAAQVKTIDDLRQQTKRDNEITLELANHLADVNTELMSNTAQLAALKNGNPDVRSYLDAPVPADLRKLYDQPKAAGSRAH